MQRRILLTSFTTWKPHHVSNSSDDLLELLSSQQSQWSLRYLRTLPVDHRRAPGILVARFRKLRPDILICCGMAEKREKLSIESRAVLNNKTVVTDVDLELLTRGLTMTEISHDAGEFVCNTLYFKALTHLKRRRHRCIFVHVPVLTAHNAGRIMNDFLAIVERLSVAQAARRNRLPS